MNLDEKIVDLKKKLENWKKDLSPKNIKSIINQIEDQMTQLIA